MEVANIRYEGKLKRLAIEEQMKMQQRIEEQAERQRRLAIEEQMKIKQIEEEEMAKKLKLEAAAVSKKSNTSISPIYVFCHPKFSYVISKIILFHCVFFSVFVGKK